MKMLPSDRARYLFAGALATLVVGATPSSLAAPLQLPPITEPASQEHHVGKVILLELVTPDLATSKKFYGALFDWTFRDVQTDGPAYAEAFLDGRART
ncbi:MAG TPA: hypothetical protein VMH36_03165 [Alphaproteobacteria bacterium]|nr:hypothetical protein [Alphaproteobacteria bacterium]